MKISINFLKKKKKNKERREKRKKKKKSFSGMKRLKNPSSKHYEWGEAVLFGNTPHTQAQELWPK